MTTFDWATMVLYLILVFVVGLQTMRRIRTPGDFAVAGNRIVWPVLFATLAATFLGGGASLGRAGESFTDGYVFMFAASAFPIQTILVGYFVAPRLKRYVGAETVGDVMDEHYGRKARLLTGIISVAYCAGVLGVQALALGTIFSSIVGISITTGILISMAIVLLYSTAGGMWADVQTDVLQFFMLGIFLPVALVVAVSNIGGPGELIARVPDAHSSFIGTYTAIGFVTVFLSFALGEALVPPYAQRAYSAPDAANARKGYAIAGVFGLLFYFVSATLGLVALVLFPNITPDQALPTLVREVLPVGITGLVVAALLAVVMSTADSYLNSTTVAFVKDIYQPFVDPNLPDSRKLWLERVVNVTIGAAATVFALAVPSIVDALLYAYALWAPTIIVPLLLAVLWGFRSEIAALSAMIAGLAVTALWTWGLGEPFGITGLITGLAANVLAFVVAYNVFDKGRRSTMPEI